MAQLVEPLSQKYKLLEYVVEKVLGQGGFGTTYLCRDENLKKQVLLKEFTPHNLVRRNQKGGLEPLNAEAANSFSKSLSQFLEEARKLAQFRHANIVRVNRYFEAQGTAYFVMDYEAGASLRDIITDVNGGMSEQEIEDIVAPLCEGLAELHRSGLVHRDIKPDNIIVRPDGSPALIDFGAVMQFSKIVKGPTTFVGTAAYAPLEQFDPNGNIGPWTDIYAMAAVMYEMTIGDRPTPARDRNLGAQIVPASAKGRGKHSDRILRLIDQCLSLEVNERPQSINECLILLQPNRDLRFHDLINNISFKMAAHFCNWAKPNEGLNVDELIAFMVVFPAIDLSWRIGKGLSDKETTARLMNSTSQSGVRYCLQVFAERGFRAVDRLLSPSFVLSRMDEYAATYLLDRKQEEWRYELTCKQLAENCIAGTHRIDMPGFMGLMEAIIDGARGRVKREFAKIYRKVEYRRDNNGWIKEVVALDDQQMN